MSDDFLTKTQVQQLTGLKRTTAQRRFLSSKNVRSDVNRRGELLVLWSEVQRMMGIKRPAKEETPEPNWDALYGKKAS